MKLQSRSKKFVVRASFVCGLSLALSACMTGNGDFSDGTETTDTNLVSGVLSVVGLESQHNTDIEYKERAPLVMPTQAGNLPQPDSRKLSEVASNWPVDRSKEELEEIRAFYKVEPGQPLSVEQMRGHPAVLKASARPRDFAAEKRQQELLDGDKLSPAELAALGRQYQEAKKQLGGKDVEAPICSPEDPTCKPTRKYLTEPPVAYSTPVAGVAFATPEVDESELVRKKREAAAIEDGARIDMSKQ
ncbi:hypothetical protein SAMN05444141_105138 [Pseudovibrio denitrificans]|uniref:Beta-barrel assembly machine subunit BamF n=2 Tax=Pseudovibrio denitrificans TaxID=258256 RepID=A0A1I7C402_9HYPH|nr:hypothetical protein [Pseudovibrio denitrificans]SFT94142.1 hypothetical protein SAMN05444141_105138 [Pseudovibrio denitrificans]